MLYGNEIFKNLVKYSGQVRKVRIVKKNNCNLLLFYMKYGFLKTCSSSFPHTIYEEFSNLINSDPLIVIVKFRNHQDWHYTVSLALLFLLSYGETLSFRFLVRSSLRAYIQGTSEQTLKNLSLIVHLDILKIFTN